MSDEREILELLGISEPITLSPLNREEVSSREVFGDERTCSNCSLHTECWGPTPNTGLPLRFRLRNGWTDERMVNHLKGVVGQICGGFNPSNPERRAHFQRADARRELRRAQEQRIEDDGWDTEENQ